MLHALHFLFHGPAPLPITPNWIVTESYQYWFQYISWIWPFHTLCLPPKPQSRSSLNNCNSILNNWAIIILLPAFPQTGSTATASVNQPMFEGHDKPVLIGFTDQSYLFNFLGRAVRQKAQLPNTHLFLLSSPQAITSLPVVQTAKKLVIPIHLQLEVTWF